MQLNKKPKKKRFILNIETQVYMDTSILICMEPCFALTAAIPKDSFGSSLSEEIDCCHLRLFSLVLSPSGRTLWISFW